MTILKRALCVRQLVSLSMATVLSLPVLADTAEDSLPSFDYLDSLGTDTLQDEAELLFQDIPSVYSASKYEQKVTEAPSSVSIVTADEIRKYGYRTLNDILASLRGFIITKSFKMPHTKLRSASIMQCFLFNRVNAHPKAAVGSVRFK